MFRRWSLLLLVVAVPIGILIWYRACPKPVQTTRLEITIIGGFAFVPTPADRLLEIAYLNDFVLRSDTNQNGVMDPNEPAVFDDINKNGVRDPGEPDVCNVDQVGTELKVMQGTVSLSEPAALSVPASREFNLDGAVLTFPALEAASLPLSIDRSGWPPSPSLPSNPDDETQWRDTVPSLKDYHPGTTINPNWRTMVNGRVVLKGGAIKTALPSSPILKRAHFEFKAGTILKLKAATSDTLIYTADVPAGEIEILMNPPAMGFTRLKIQPQGDKVALTLRGKHGSSAQPMAGMPLHDFCAFYQLLQPMPAPAEFLLPHYVPAPPPPGNNVAAMPSPGWFCPGDWF